MMSGKVGAKMADGASHMSSAQRALRLVALAVFGLMLGACSKCDVPTPWQRSSAGETPAACHSDPAPQ
jgi:hypothetical protein